MRARFDRIFRRRTGFVTLDRLLARLHANVLDRLTSGKLKPVIAKSFPLDQIVEAHRFLQSNQQIGKIIVTVD